MTPRPRRKKVKGGSVIDGLRLERDVADQLVEQTATSGARNVAEFARFCIRTGLGCAPAEANRREADEYLVNSGLAGLGLDAVTRRELEREAVKLGCTKASLARQLIRRTLGYTDAESTKREAGFTALADMYQGRFGAFHGAGE